MPRPPAHPTAAATSPARRGDPRPAQHDPVGRASSRARSASAPPRSPRPSARTPPRPRRSPRAGRAVGCERRPAAAVDDHRLDPAPRAPAGGDPRCAAIVDSASTPDVGASSDRTPGGASHRMGQQRSPGRPPPQRRRRRISPGSPVAPGPAFDAAARRVELDHQPASPAAAVRASAAVVTPGAPFADTSPTSMRVTPPTPRSTPAVRRGGRHQPGLRPAGRPTRRGRSRVFSASPEASNTQPSISTGSPCEPAGGPDHHQHRRPRERRLRTGRRPGRAARPRPPPPRPSSSRPAGSSWPSASSEPATRSTPATRPTNSSSSPAATDSTSESSDEARDAQVGPLDHLETLDIARP